MSATPYTHHSQDITVENCIDGASDTQTVTLPKGTWQKKLDKVNRKIKKFKINEDIKWVMSVNDKNIEPSNVIQFEQILSVISPPIVIKIIKVTTSLGLFEFYNLSSKYVHCILR